MVETWLKKKRSCIEIVGFASFFALGKEACLRAASACLDQDKGMRAP